MARHQRHFSLPFHSMLQTGQPFFVFLVNELTNAGFNILSYYVEEDNLSKIMRRLRVDHNR